jgi:hypothetical protein
MLVPRGGTAAHVDTLLLLRGLIDGQVWALASHAPLPRFVLSRHAAAQVRGARIRMGERKCCGPVCRSASARG